MDFIREIQAWRSPLTDPLMIAITVLGGEASLLALVCLVHWRGDRRLAGRLGVLLFVSVYLNGLLKNAFQQPRPTDLDPGIGLVFADGYGFPSGHAQISAAVLGLLGRHFESARIHLLATAAIFLIGFSRVYLGVHFPTDVVAGWLVAGILLAVFIALDAPVGSWLSSQSTVNRVWAIGGTAIALLLFYPSVGSAGALGTLAGFSIGVTLEEKEQVERQAVSLPALALALVAVLAGHLAIRFVWNQLPVDPALQWSTAFAAAVVLGLAITRWAPRWIRKGRE